MNPITKVLRSAAVTLAAVTPARLCSGSAGTTRSRVRIINVSGAAITTRIINAGSALPSTGFVGFIVADDAEREIELGPRVELVAESAGGGDVYVEEYETAPVV